MPRPIFCTEANLKKVVCLLSTGRVKKKKKVTSRQQVEHFFFQSLCLERYMIKRFKKINSWYNKNVTLYIFIFNFYVQFLCWFIIIWWWLISVKVLSCVPIQIKQTNISIFLLIFRLTVSFVDPLWFAIYHYLGV